MRGHANRLSKYLNDVGNFEHEIRQELASLEGSLKALEKRLPREYKSSATELSRAIAAVESGQASSDLVRKVHLQLIKVNQRLSEYEKDRKWER
jgi:hypothetical protein